MTVVSVSCDVLLRRRCIRGGHGPVLGAVAMVPSGASVSSGSGSGRSDGMGNLVNLL